MVQVFICPMYELCTTSWKFKLIFVPRNPILTTFIVNETSVRNITVPYLRKKGKKIKNEVQNKIVSRQNFSVYVQYFQNSMFLKFYHVLTIFFLS